MRLDGLTLTHGMLEGQLTVAEGAPTPMVDLTVDGTTVSQADVQPTAPGAFLMRAPVPEAALDEGVSTVVFQDRATRVVLGRYVFRSGGPVDGDVVAELDALAAEVAALKRAFMSDAADRKLRAADKPLIIEEVVTDILRHLAGAGKTPPRSD
ncbi:MAG: hypothetical protein AAF409_12475 [Pseudomonadota bacterium]